eukprot:869188_1
MSNNIDKKKMRQNAMDIKSQRKERIEETKQQEEIEEDNKDQTIIFDALSRMRQRGITNTSEFSWKIMYNEYKYNNKNDKNDNNNKNGLNYDEKENENKKIKQNQRLSQLINVKNDEMCQYGHGEFDDDEDDIVDSKCIICGSMDERKYCDDCVRYDEDRTGKDWKDLYGLHIYCKDCRIKNGENIKNRIKMDRFKSDIIRGELLQNPTLEMDVLCNMQRKASIDSLMYDINKLEPNDRGKWSLFLFDIDHLKCWNTAMGHPKTDLLIKQIGNVFHKYVKDINNGLWNDEEKGELKQAFTFRTGGDEFMLAVRSGGGAYWIPLGPFYYSFRKDINNIGINLKEIIFNNNENEWNNVKKALDKSKDRNGNPINMNKVGISTGLFIPCCNKNICKDWISLTDKKALEHAKTIHLPTKNGIAIYYEEIGGLIADEKVEKCLEKGVLQGLY